MFKWVGLSECSHVFLISSDIVLENFKRFQMEKRTGKTQLTNAQQVQHHAKHFCFYMLSGLPSSAGCEDLTFLYQMDKLNL